MSHRKLSLTITCTVLGGRFAAGSSLANRVLDRKPDGDNGNIVADEEAIVEQPAVEGGGGAQLKDACWDRGCAGSSSKS
jgi:hypothetical protein